MKKSQTRKKLFITCIVFMCVFMVLFVVSLQSVTNASYFEALAEAEVIEMQQIYNLYFDLRNHYENILTLFTKVGYVDSEIERIVLESSYPSKAKATESVKEFAAKSSDYIETMDIYIISKSNIIYMHNHYGTPQVEIKDYESTDSFLYTKTSDVESFLVRNGAYKKEDNYNSSHLIIKKLEKKEDIFVVGIPRYDKVFDFCENKIVVYNRLKQEELRLNTNQVQESMPSDIISKGKNYVTYGLGNNRRIVCFYSNNDEQGDYCIGVIKNIDLNFRYIIYACLILFFAAVSVAMWFWSETVTKPLDFFMKWIKLVKDKDTLDDEENPDMIIPKENYLLQNNIMLFFSFCLVPIIFAGALQWYVENQVLNEHIEQRYIQSAQMYGEILDEKFEAWQSPVSMLSNDERIVEALLKNKKSEEFQVDEELEGYVSEYTKLMADESDKVTIYNTKGTVLVSSRDNLSNDRYVKYRVNVDETYKWTFIDGLKKFDLHQKVFDEDGTIAGYCKLEINDANFNPNVLYKAQTLYSCYIYKYTDKIFNLVSSPSLTDEKVANMIRSTKEYPFAKSLLLENANINYFYIVKENILFDKIWNKYVISFMNVVFFFSIVLIFSASVLTRTTLNPVIHLSNTLYNDSPQLPMSTLLLGKEEFALIVNRVKTLSEQVDSYAKEQKLLEAERLEHEKKRKDAEILTLQTQINPHFMYNIFSSIAVLIKTGQTEKATKMVMYTGNLMRMGLYRGHVMIPLKEEIDHVNQYIKIQQIRYNNCMEIVFDIDDDMMILKVVKFILQPILENAIEHNVGYLEDRKLKINIGAYKQNNELVLFVEDNGLGLDDEQVEKLQKSINNFDMSDHLGLANINERIKLNCGNEYGVTLVKNTDNGLRVELILPIVVEKEE